MDDEILNTVHSIFGKSVQVVDCEKTSSVCHEEELLINGIPVQSGGSDAESIKAALLSGQVPSVNLLNQFLCQAGILRQPVQLETSISVKSSMVTTEEISVARDGQILDERKSKTKENYNYQSSNHEIWKPTSENSRRDCPPTCSKNLTHVPEETLKKDKKQKSAIYSSNCETAAANNGEFPNNSNRKYNESRLLSQFKLKNKCSSGSKEDKTSLRSPFASDNKNSRATASNYSVAEEFEDYPSGDVSIYQEDGEDDDNNLNDGAYDNFCNANTLNTSSSATKSFSETSASNYSTYSSSSSSSSLAFLHPSQNDYNTPKDQPELLFECERLIVPKKANYTTMKLQNTEAGGKDFSRSCDSGHDGIFDDELLYTIDHNYLSSQGLCPNQQGNNMMIQASTDRCIASCFGDKSLDETDEAPKFRSCAANNVVDLHFSDRANKNGKNLYRVSPQLSNNSTKDQKNVNSSHQSSVGGKPSMSSSSYNCGISTSPIICTSNLGATSVGNNGKVSSATNQEDDSFTMCHGPTAKQQKQYQFLQPQTTLSKSISSTNYIENIDCSGVWNDDKVTAHTSTKDHYLVFRNGNLISGSLDALIQHMVPTSEYYPEHSYIFSFLLSARLFIRPHELLGRIGEIWQKQQNITGTKATTTTTVSADVVDKTAVEQPSIQSPKMMTTHHQSNKQHTPPFSTHPLTCLNEDVQSIAIKSAQNCIRFLAEWIDTFPYDFRDERLMQQVRILARKCVYIDKSLGKIVSRILQNLVQRLTVLEKYEEFLQTLASSTDGCAQEITATGTTKTDSQVESSLYPSTGSGIASKSSSSECYPNQLLLSRSAATNTNIHHPENHQHLSELGDSLETEIFLTENISRATAVATTTSHLYQNSHFSSHQNKTQSNSLGNTTKTSESASVSSSGSMGSPVAFGELNLVGIFDLCPNAAILAHQLTNIELERLSHIGPEEFVQAFAKENQLESFSDMKKTRNLESYVQWFNRLSYLTATEIVKYPKKKQRVRIIELWIETARECFNNGNFNSLMAIIAGLNLSPISRLKKTWAKIQSAKFSVLEHQMDPTSNFNSYRSTLKAAMWRFEGATNERERIIIPFFSLLVKDLYFLNEGCSNRLPNGHINFEKFWQLAKQVMEFNTWKKVTCPFEKQPKVITFLQNSSVLNENTLSMASFECEPPENTQEKGRYKSLKSETKQQQ